MTNPRINRNIYALSLQSIALGTLEGASITEIQLKTKERKCKGLIAPYKPKEKGKRAKRRNKAK